MSDLVRPLTTIEKIEDKIMHKLKPLLAPKFDPRNVRGVYFARKEMNKLVNAAMRLGKSQIEALNEILGSL